jgi:hypothetical protein
VVDLKGGEVDAVDALVDAAAEDRGGPDATLVSEPLEGEPHGTVMVVARTVQIGAPVGVADDGAGKSRPIPVECNREVVHRRRKNYAGDTTRYEDFPQAARGHAGFLEPKLGQRAAELFRPEARTGEDRIQVMPMVGGENFVPVSADPDESQRLACAGRLLTSDVRHERGHAQIGPVADFLREPANAFNRLGGNRGVGAQRVRRAAHAQPRGARKIAQGLIAARSQFTQRFQ